MSQQFETIQSSQNYHIYEHICQTYTFICLFFVQIVVQYYPAMQLSALFKDTQKNLIFLYRFTNNFFCCLLLNKFVESLTKKHSSNIEMSKISYHQYEHQYRKIGEIGKGSFGKVLKVLHESTQHQYALKVQTLSKQEQIDEANMQIQILKRFHHPLIVQLHAYYKVNCRNKNYFFSRRRELQEIGMLLQLGQYSLDKIIKEDKNFLQEQVLFNFAVEFIQLFAWLEDQNMVHRDIKPQNIMIFKEPLQCKLIDFGLSKNLNEAHTSIAGTQKYASPKLKAKIRFQRVGIKSNPVKDDVYSFGVTLLELVTKDQNNSYSHRTFQQVVKICKKQRIAILLEYMLQEQEQKRPTFKQLLCIIEQKQMISKEMKIESVRLAVEKKQRQVQTERYFLQSKKKISSEIQFSLPQETQKLIRQDPLNYDFDSPGIKQTVKKLNLPQQTPIKTFQICVNAGLRCLYNYKDMIICGTDNGQLRLIRNKQLVYTPKIHNKFITNFIEGQDKKYFYSFGGDNKILKFNKEHIYNNFETKVHLQQRSKKNIFKKVTEMISIYDLRENEDYTVTQLPDQHEIGISYVTIKDDENFIVGYFDGTIYYQWKGIKRFLKKFAESAPITSLQIFQDILFLSDGDGNIKSIQLTNTKFLNHLHCAKKLIVNLKVLPDEQQSSQVSKEQNILFNIAYLTIDGKVQFLNHEGKLQSSQNLKMNNVMQCKQIKGNIYTLLASGQLYQEKKQLMKLQTSNKTHSNICWNCMTELTDNSLVFGSFQGNLLIYKL